MPFASTLIWYHTYKQIHTASTETNGVTHKYISTTSVMCSQQLVVLNWINHSLISETIRVSAHKSKTTNINLVNEQKTHTTQRNMTLERVSVKIVIPLIFRTTPLRGRIQLCYFERLFANEYTSSPTFFVRNLWSFADLNWLNWFQFLILEGGLLVILVLIDCRTFLSSILDVTRQQFLSTVSLHS